MELTKTINTKGYKQTEFGFIPDDWKVGNLLQNFTLKARIGWQGLTTAEYLQTGDYGLVTGTDFKNGYIDWDNCVYVEKNRFIQDKNIQLKVGDVLVTKDGTIGKVAFVDRLPNPTTLNSGVFVVRSNNSNIDNRYFYYILMSSYFDDFLAKITAGSTITHLYQKDFVTFSFILPTKAEQKAIATALSDVDELISSLEQLITKKKAIKQGAMQELLTPKEGWEVKSLGEVADYKNGAAHENCVVENGEFIIVNSKFVSTEGRVKKYSNYNLCPVYKNEILMVLSDVPNGKAIAKCFIVEKDNKYTLNQRICALKSKEMIDSKFLFLILNRNPYYLQFDDGVKQTNLRNQDVLSCPLWIPKSLQEQTRIAQILSDMDLEIASLEAKKEKYQGIKQGMMQELLTGKTRLV